MRERLQAIQDGIGILALVPAALARFADGRPLDIALAAVEIAAAAGVAISTARDLRDRGNGHRIGWTGIFAGIVMLADGALRVAHGHRWFNPQIVLGLVLLGLGALRPALARRLAGRRRIRLDAERIGARLSPLRRFDVAWRDVEAVEVDERRIRLQTRHGEHSIGLRHYRNAAQIRDALVAGARAAGVEVRSTCQ